MQKQLTTADVAEALQMSKWTICKWVREGKMPATVLPSGELRFSEQILQSWIEKRTTKKRIA